MSCRNEKKEALKAADKELSRKFWKSVLDDIASPIALVYAAGGTNLT